MPGLFPSWSDGVFRFVLLALLFSITAGALGLMIYVRTPYDQNRDFQVEQPVQFDHRHHVRDAGIECLYCHAGAENSAFAGVPATEVCMGCHAQIWNRSARLAPVRESFFSSQPIAWKRVHDLPDFVYFNHGVHVQAGVQCAQCHGDVANMPVVHKVQSLSMGFCLDCHRDPAEHVAGYRTRTPDAPIWLARSGTTDRAAHVVSNPLITCTACHR
jgi:hypothetical protein